MNTTASTRELYFKRKICWQISRDIVLGSVQLKKILNCSLQVESKMEWFQVKLKCLIQSRMNGARCLMSIILQQTQRFVYLTNISYINLEESTIMEKYAAKLRDMMCTQTYGIQSNMIQIPVFSKLEYPLLLTCSLFRSIIIK